MSNNPLSNLIYAGESRASGYDAYNRGTHKDAQHHDCMDPLCAPLNVSRLTIKEIQRLQALPHSDPDHIRAVGAYQLMPKTLINAVDTLHLDINQKFSPEVQEHIFANYLIVNERPKVHAYITGANGATLVAAQSALAGEWASLGDPAHNGATGLGSPNHASITLSQTAAALNQMRDSYQSDIRKGLSPEQAWQAVTATDIHQTHGHRTRHETGHPAPAADAGVATARSEVASSSARDTRDAARSGSRSTELAEAATARGASAHDHRHQDASWAGVLREGDQGAAVRGLQVDLNEHVRTGHGHPLQVDDRFGAATEHAVMAFQRRHDLVVDGIVGTHTRQALAGQAHAHHQAQPVPEHAPGPSARAVPDASVHDMFERIHAAVSTRSEHALAEAARIYLRTEAGQAWLKAGQVNLRHQDAAQAQVRQAPAPGLRMR